MVVSLDTKVVQNNGSILTIMARHDQNFNVSTTLNMLNNVDVDGLRYSPERMREANKRKEVLLKQLEAQWSGRLNNVVPSIIHPDSTYIRTQVRVDNSITGEKSIIGNGQYDMLYFAPNSHLNCYKRAVLGRGAICEYDLFQGVPTVLGSIHRGIAVCYGEDIKGVMFLARDKSDSIVLDKLLKALDTGNLALLKSKGNMEFVLLNTCYALKKKA